MSTERSHPMLAGHYPSISTQMLPPAELGTFLESSFFSRNGAGAELPSPANVRARGAVQDPTSQGRNFAFRPVRYEELGLVVKFGRPPEMTVAEGQCLWALHRILPNVPVPEVYGWTHDDGQVFIYMELVQGATLEQRWEYLDRAERVEICEQLRVMILELRKLRHAPGKFFLGHINREPLGDIVFTNQNRPPAGPFHSVAQFHDWISIVIKTGVRHHWTGMELDQIPDPYRNGMPDEAEVVFTHADLHPSNIIVSKESPCRILAIIDWRQSGWYPDYWEFCKAEYTAEVDGEWMNVYIPLFLNKPSCVEMWDPGLLC
ncbi:kinase-like domain-containing protein [Diplogelasinospora grovesii]|uniref:Kinase-like domain-containing protein n=1 Tax=Diplogelasinospora grovesii TaxID=303347 RepID=A0AAN6N3Q3_9PEZI|nr:kinase-like domain-containing protein [Diplogelasinospora grovesii]